MRFQSTWRPLNKVWQPTCGLHWGPLGEGPREDESRAGKRPREARGLAEAAWHPDPAAEERLRGSRAGSALGQPCDWLFNLSRPQIPPLQKEPNDSMYHRELFGEIQY